MPYTDDPEHNPLDQVRFLLGDTNNAALDLTDNEVAYLLESEGDDTLRAAARGAENLAAKFTRTAEEKRVGPLSVRESTSSGKSKAERFAMLAKMLWARIAGTTGGPWAGGISKTDKQMRDHDSDRVEPAFKRDMQKYPSGSPGASQEELLG